MLEDPRLSRNNVRVPKRDGYVKHPVLSSYDSPRPEKDLGFNVRSYWHEALVKLLMKCCTPA